MSWRELVDRAAAAAGAASAGPALAQFVELFDGRLQPAHIIEDFAIILTLPGILITARLV